MPRDRFSSLNGQLNSIILFVTCKCDSRCKTCFYWEYINKYKDLTLDDFKVISNRLPIFKHMLLSGGEPFLRNDLPEIINIFITQNRVKNIGIPTNGHQSRKIKEITETVIQANPDVSFEINCSLDGFRETHNTIRGVSKSFDNVINTINLLKKLKKYKNFRLTINTVINNLNADEIEALINFVKGLEIDCHYFALLRGTHPGILTLPSLPVLEKINNLRYNARKYYNRKSSRFYGLFANRLYRKVISNQMKASGNKKWNVDCVAGENTFVIDANSDLRICELQPPIGNILKSSLIEILNSKIAQEQMNNRDKHKCDCVHICFISESLECNIQRGKIWKAWI